jgi:hypothetical protein
MAIPGDVTITMPSTDEVKRGIYAGPIGMARRDVTLPGSVARVLIVGLAVPAVITDAQRDALNTAVKALPGVAASLLLASHPVEHFADYTTRLVLNSNVRHDPVPVTPPGP